MAKIPGQAPLIADLAVKNLDFPDAQALADRLKKALPPQFQDTPQQQIPPEVQQMMAQTQQEMQQLQQQNQAMSQIIANKQQELDVKLHIEQMKIESQEKIELAKLHNKEALEVLTHEMEMIKLQQSKQDQVLNQFEIENEESGADAGSEGMNGN
jgi:signal transduction histidine kinase